MVGSVIGLQQVIVTLVFLASLVGILVFLKMKGGMIRRSLHQNRRISIIEDTALSPTERMRLVCVDNTEFVIVSAKGATPVMMPLNAMPDGVGVTPPRKAQFSSGDKSPLVLTETAEADDHPNKAQASPVQPTSAPQGSEDAAVQLKAFREKFESWRQS